MKNIDPGEKTPVINTQSNPLSTQEAFDTIVQAITPGTIKGADVDWFDLAKTFNTFPSERAASCRVEFIFSGNDAKISFTYDGVKYGELYEGTTLKAGALYSIITSVEQGNDFNLKASESVTIDKCIMAVIGKQDGPIT